MGGIACRLARECRTAAGPSVPCRIGRLRPNHHVEMLDGIMAVAVENRPRFRPLSRQARELSDARMTFRVDGKRAIYNDEESRRENEMAKTNRRSGVGAKANYKNMNTKILFARYTKTVIWIISTLLASYFTFLQVRDAQIGAFVNTVSADIIWRIALVIYYLCWVFGTNLIRHSRTGLRRVFS